MAIDEGGIAFAKELAGEAGTGYITPQKRMITQLRSSGIGLIIGAQSASGIDNAVAANVGTYLCLGARADADIRLSATLLELPDDRRDEIRRIPKWKGLFKTPDHSASVMIDLPNVEMGDYLSDSTVAELNQPAFARLNEGVIFSPETTETSNPIRYMEVLGETDPEQSTAEDEPLPPFDIRDEHRAFVREILAHPEASVVEHYRNLGFSGGRGNRIKTELLDNRVIASECMTSSNGRPIDRLSVTEVGRSLFA